MRFSPRRLRTIRILIERIHEWTATSLDGVEIIVGRATAAVKPNHSEDRETIWNNRLEIISQERFYESMPVSDPIAFTRFSMVFIVMSSILWGLPPFSRGGKPCCGNKPHIRFCLCKWLHHHGVKVKARPGGHEGH